MTKQLCLWSSIVLDCFPHRQTENEDDQVIRARLL
jgi:hypothetical protein